MSVLLSPEQKEIVQAPAGAYLVLAAAGSGKTRVLTERIRYLLQTRTTPAKIMALTFTNNAAEEMRSRLAGLPDLSRSTYIGTIHSFCQQVVESQYRTIGLDRPPTILEGEADHLEMLEAVIEDNPVLKARYKEKRDKRWLYKVREHFSKRKRQLEGYGPLPVKWQNEFEEMLYTHYNERMQSQSIIDFDDILILAYRIFTERHSVLALYQRTYAHFCMDEAQDLNFAQYTLIRTLASESGSILMVGDPNQAIYGFNGSSPDFMLTNFPDDFDVRKIELRKNYRSTRAIIRAANSLYPDSIDESLAPLQGQIVTKALADEEAEAAWVMDQISGLLAAENLPDIEGNLTPERIVVLARNRYIFTPLEKALDAAGIAWYRRESGEKSPLESELGQAYDLGLRLLINSQDMLHWGQLCQLTRSGNQVRSQGDAMQDLETLADHVDESWQLPFRWLLRAWRMIQSRIDAFPVAAESILQGINASMTDDDTTRARMELAVLDFEFLKECWKNYASSVQADSRTLLHFRNQLAMGVTNRRPEKDGIALSTVHAAKGVERDVVFLIGMSQGTFPDYRAVNKGGKAMEEEKNEAFVAVTRARRYLFISWPRKRYIASWYSHKPQEPSQFLANMHAYGQDDADQSRWVAED